MTEKFWQQEKERIRLNKSNIHPIIQQSFDDNRSILPNKNFRELYFNCNQGDMNLKQFENSDNVSLEDMGMLICRDAGCELQYCQASLTDPNDKPFSNCDEHYKKFNQCQEQEKRRYLYENEGRTMKDQIFHMLEVKKNEKFKANEIEKDKDKQLKIEQINKQKSMMKENENPNIKKRVIEEKI